MGALQDSIYFAIFLGVLVTVHESGHFLAAKWAGVKVLKFSIGFGPRLFGFRRGETEYQIAALPLGGYVAMAGQYPGEEIAPEDRGRSFVEASWWKRFIILSAGPGANLIFPIFAFFFAFIGDHQVMAPRIQWVEPGFPAAVAGLVPGDLIKSVDGRPIRAFDEIRPALDNVFERSIPVLVERDGKDVMLQITPLKNVETNQVEKIARGLLGVSPVARSALIGIPDGSPAAAAGLKTFDRILSVNGQIIKDELQLSKVLDAAVSPLSIVAVRTVPHDVGGLAVIDPSLITATVEKQPGKGLQALGVESSDLYLWNVIPGSPAAKAGVKVGDRLVSINGTALSSWYTFQLQLKAIDKGKFELSWRSGAELETQSLSQVSEDVLDELKNKSEVNELGLRQRSSGDVLSSGPDAEHVTIHMGVVDAFSASLKTVPDAVRQIALVLGKLFTRDIPLESVGGPILLFQVASKSAEMGYETFLKNMAMVSVNLALVNLLPIPILDGFGLLAAAWEGIRRRPIPSRAREVANMIGFAMLALLVVLVFKNDITKLLR
jgi:regulator of sigma E protease